MMEDGKRKRGVPERYIPEDSPPNTRDVVYCVLEFIGTRETAIVPEDWIFNKEGQDFCYWPPGLSAKNIRKAIRGNAVPDEGTWESYLARVHDKGSYDKCFRREDAVMYASLTESSDTEPLTSVTRKRKKIRKEDNAAGVLAMEAPGGSGGQVNVAEEAPGGRGGQGNRALEPDVNEPDANIEGQRRVRRCRSCNCPDCIAKEKANVSFQAKVLRKLVELKVELQATVAARKAGVEPFRAGNIQIPLQTVADMKRLDASLTPALIKDLKEKLKHHVDDKLYHTALGMMKSIFTIPFMRHLNWNGKRPGKTGLMKEAPKLAQVIIDGAKEAVGDKWTLSEVKAKLKIILVKAVRMTVPGNEEQIVLNPLDDSDEEREVPPPGENGQPPQAAAPPEENDVIVDGADDN